METNKVLLILYKSHDIWIEIGKKLLYKDDDQLVKDIVQDMYLSIYDQIENKQIKVNELIINNKPHYGIIKRTIKQLIQKNANKENRIKKNTNIVLQNIEATKTENIEEIKKEINSIINELYWFDKKLFKLYLNEFNSIRKLSKATKISHVKVFNTINKCRNNIKRKLNEK